MRVFALTEGEKRSIKLFGLLYFFCFFKACCNVKSVHTRGTRGESACCAGLDFPPKIPLDSLLPPWG